MITLHVDLKNPPYAWESFVATKPPFSIALDGYVSTGPRFDATGPYLNANHHEEVDRLSTRATCAQILMALRQGGGRRAQGVDRLCFGVVPESCGPSDCRQPQRQPSGDLRALQEGCPLARSRELR